MPRTFKTADYAVTLKLTVSLEDAVPPNHLARFIVDVIAQLDLSQIYARYGERGGEAFAPQLLLGLLFYGYATGVFSSRKIEKATYESLPFRFLSGDLHPDHDTWAHFRKTFLPELKDRFIQILLVAQTAGVLKLGNLSLDGTKIHADASKSKAVSYKRLLELEHQLQTEVDELFTLGEQAEQIEQIEAQLGLLLPDEISLRQEQLARLAEAKTVLEARAQVRYEAEQADYQAKIQARAEQANKTKRPPRGPTPQPPTPGPQDKDPYNFTDPDSRIMKNSTDQGFDQHYNAQAAVEQDSFLVVANALSNHPNDKAEALPTLNALAPELGRPDAVALDNGFFSAANIAGIEARGIEPYIATGREAHHQSWQALVAEQPAPPPDDASPKIKMAYKLQTDIGRAIYRLRKCTVEPVIGSIKEILGFRQFSLRGLGAAAGEWSLVCLAFNLKRLHILLVN
jgi:transposase